MPTGLNQRGVEQGARNSYASYREGAIGNHGVHFINDSDEVSVAELAAAVQDAGVIINMW